MDIAAGIPAHSASSALIDTLPNAPSVEMIDTAANGSALQSESGPHPASPSKSSQSYQPVIDSSPSNPPPLPSDLSGTHHLVSESQPTPLTASTSADASIPILPRNAVRDAVSPSAIMRDVESLIGDSTIIADVHAPSSVGENVPVIQAANTTAVDSDVSDGEPVEHPGAPSVVTTNNLMVNGNASVSSMEHVKSDEIDGLTPIQRHALEQATAGRREKGVSCHQCKTTKDGSVLLFCVNRAEKGKRKRSCRKKYVSQYYE
jgi:hypothetical protein